MKIQIYGTGCQKCRDLYDNAVKAVAECDIAAEVQKVEDIVQITDAGVFLTPAFAVDGDIKSSGKLLSVADIKKILVE